MTNVYSKSRGLIEEHRYQVRKAFEEGAPLQYKLINAKEWSEAFWCGWEWDKYDYRIKPKETVKVEKAVPLHPYLLNGSVVWHTTERVLYNKSRRLEAYQPILRFRTTGGVRHAIIEEVQP
jgi:hypothetical protein